MLKNLRQTIDQPRIVTEIVPGWSLTVKDLDEEVSIQDGGSLIVTVGIDPSYFTEYDDDIDD